MTSTFQGGYNSLENVLGKHGKRKIWTLKNTYWVESNIIFYFSD